MGHSFDALEDLSLLANVADVKSLVIPSCFDQPTRSFQKKFAEQGIRPNTDPALNSGTEHIRRSSSRISNRGFEL
ncbi:hypothetical protein [Dubosiella newyorkensis]|uniref:hypothetical protein n=1 Tax=Dubosiella newyorkensis TaxID=1862672 RepID=UPI003F671368